MLVVVKYKLGVVSSVGAICFLMLIENMSPRWGFPFFCNFFY